MHGAEKPLDLTFALGLVGFGVNQGDAQRSGDLLEVKGAKGRAVVCWVWGQAFVDS
jgi:hypothetical protein